MQIEYWILTCKVLDQMPVISAYSAIFLPSLAAIWCSVANHQALLYAPMCRSANVRRCLCYVDPFSSRTARCHETLHCAHRTWVLVKSGSAEVWDVRVLTGKKRQINCGRKVRDNDLKMQPVIGNFIGNQLTDNRVTSSEDTAWMLYNWCQV